MLIAAATSAAADVTYVVHGVGESLASNVQSHLGTGMFGPRVRLYPEDRDRIVENAIAKARAALRPYGFYNPTIEGQLTAEDPEAAIVELTIDAGPRMQVAELDISVIGAGARDRRFKDWQSGWPLQTGATLDQTVWEQAKRDAIEIASSRGYLNARFVEHRLELDVEENAASIVLLLDTGPRFVMGDVDFGRHGLKPGILEYAPRFEKGDPYVARLVSQLRTDLWKTGYFDDISVFEIHHPERTPPEVDLKEVLLALKDVLHRADMFSSHQVTREPLSLRERMSRVLQSVSPETFTKFTDLFDISEGRSGVVVTFMAILELIKQQMIELVQAESFAPIHVRARGG